KMCEASGTPSESPPVLLSRVPLPASAKVLMTHVERFPFGIGSGGPKLHPTSVQSMPPPPPLVGARSQMLPVQGPTTQPLVAPSGMSPSGTDEAPPPRSSEPHAMLRSTVLAPSRTDPQLPLPAMVVTSSSSVPGGSVVVVVGVVLVVLVEEPPVIVVVVVVGEAVPRLGAEQAGMGGASALAARKEPASSRRIVPGPKTAQLRSVPVVTRMATVPCAPASARPVAAAPTLSCLPCFSMTTFKGDGPAGAAEFEYLKESMLASTTFQPGFPTPAGAASTGRAGSFCEKSSTRRPPGVPVAGSSALPTAGNAKVGTVDWNTSFPLPDDDRRSWSFFPLIARSSAAARRAGSR